MKSYAESKTIWFNLALAVVGVLEVTDWAEIVPEDYVGLVALGVALVGVTLRVVTTKPVGR